MAYTPAVDPWGRAPAPNELATVQGWGKPNTYGTAAEWAGKNIPGMLTSAWNSGGGDWQKWLDPNNPWTSQFAQNRLGTARNMGQQAANQVERAGIAGGRGGYGVAGGAPMGATLAQQNLRNVAGQAGDAYGWGAEMTARGAPLAADDWKTRLNLAGNMGSLWSNLLGGKSAEELAMLNMYNQANQRDTAWDRQQYSQYPKDLQEYDTWKSGLTARNQQQQQQGDLASLLDRVSRSDNVTMNDPRWWEINKLRLMSNMSTGRPPFPGMG